jgi:hypothetical protein
MLRQASASGKAPTEQRPGSASVPAGWADWQGANWQLPGGFASYAGPVPTHGIPPGFALVPPGVLVPLDALHVRPAVLFTYHDVVLLTGILTVCYMRAQHLHVAPGGAAVPQALAAHQMRQLTHAPAPAWADQSAAAAAAAAAWAAPRQGPTPRAGSALGLSGRARPTSACRTAAPSPNPPASPAGYLHPDLCFPAGAYGAVNPGAGAAATTNDGGSPGTACYAAPSNSPATPAAQQAEPQAPYSDLTPFSATTCSAPVKKGRASAGPAPGYTPVQSEDTGEGARGIRGVPLQPMAFTPGPGQAWHVPEEARQHDAARAWLGGQGRMHPAGTPQGEAYGPPAQFAAMPGAP